MLFSALRFFLATPTRTGAHKPTRPLLVAGLAPSAAQDARFVFCYSLMLPCLGDPTNECVTVPALRLRPMEVLRIVYGPWSESLFCADLFFSEKRSIRRTGLGRGPDADSAESGAGGMNRSLSVLVAPILAGLNSTAAGTAKRRKRVSPGPFSPVVMRAGSIF